MKADTGAGEVAWQPRAVGSIVEEIEGDDDDDNGMYAFPCLVISEGSECGHLGPGFYVISFSLCL